MSKVEKAVNSDKVFYKIVEGSLRQKANEGHPEAIRRDWTAGGESGTVWEIPSKAIHGIITDVSFYEGEKDGRKFTTLNIAFDENEDGKTPVVTVGIDTKYAQDILKKLPSVKLDQEVRLRPFSFMPEGEDRNVVGVEMTHRDHMGNFTIKIKDYFYDGEKNREGYPVPPKAKEDMTSKDWKRYFEDAHEYVIEYVKEKIVPKFSKEGRSDAALEEVLDEPLGSDPDKIPF